MVRVSKLGTQWRRVTPRRQNMRRIVSLGETRLRVTRNPIFCHPLPNAGCHDLGVFDGVFDKVVLRRVRQCLRATSFLPVTANNAFPFVRQNLMAGVCRVNAVPDPVAGGSPLAGFIQHALKMNQGCIVLGGELRHNFLAFDDIGVR